jgi:hypothetical protein
MGDVYRARDTKLNRDVALRVLPAAFALDAGSLDLHPDGARFAVAAVPPDQVTAKQDKVVFLFNFFDELTRLAPAGK